MRQVFTVFFVAIFNLTLLVGLGSAREIGRYKSLTAYVNDDFRCGDKARITVEAPDPSFFSGDRVPFQRLVGSARAALGFECSKIKSILIGGKAGKRLVYRGISAEDRELGHR